MELKLLNAQGQPAGTAQVSDTLFARPYNEALVHQVVVAYQANARQAPRAQKDRSQVHHSTRKPWRQKGTGRARAGMTSSPLWRHGGKIFPSSPEENFKQKVNRKMFRAAMATILSQLAREDRLAVIDDFRVEAPKTKLVAQKIKDMGLAGTRVLLVTDELDENLLLGSRNLKDVLVLAAHETDPVALVHFPKVLLTKGAVAKFEEMWQ